MYKRQNGYDAVADSSISVAAFFISRIKMYGTSCERKDMKTNQIMIRPMGEFTVSPVSYTHLDVYKRQAELSVVMPQFSITLIRPVICS